MFLIHLLPALLLLSLLCDYRFTQGDTLALICPFALTLLYLNMNSVVVRRLIFTLMIIPVYLFSGAVPTCCLYAACILFELFNAKDKWKYATTLWLPVAVVLPYLWQTECLIPNEELFQIVNYPLDKSIRCLPAVLLAWIPFCLLSVRFVSQKRLTDMATGKVTTISVIVLLLVCGSYIFPKTFNRAEEQMLGMYMAAVQNDWDSVLKTGRSVKNPERHTTCLINLALAMKGELPQKMFNYPQTDEYGLLPDHHIGDYLYLCSGSVFYYHIGMLNEAIRWIFDSYIVRSRGKMDYHTLMRLAVWNKENGDEQVASKYFDILGHTLMYRSWAKRQREASIPQRMESVASPVEFYIGIREPYADMRVYYENYPDNTMILDYLLCYQLLKNDPAKFMPLFNAFYQPTKELPKAYQEALLAVAGMGGQIDINNYPIDKINAGRFLNLMSLLEKRNNDKELEKQFRDTWWYYSYRINQK
jgi:hypothetical protein